MKTGRSVGSLFASDRSIGGQRGTARHLYRQGTGTEHVRYTAFGELRPPVPQSAQELEIGYRGWQWDSDAQLFLQGSQPYDPYTGRWLTEAPFGLRTDPTNAYTVNGNSPLGSGTRHAPRISHQGAASWTDSFGESYVYYLNPANDYRDGNYVWMVGKGIGWSMFAVGTLGAGTLAGGGTTVAGIGVYLATQAGISAAETGLEGGLANLTGDQSFHWGASYLKNFAINATTGGIGNKLTWGGKLGAYALRRGIEIAGDTAIDVGVYDRNLGQSLAWNTAASIGGEAAFKLAGKGLNVTWTIASSPRFRQGAKDLWENKLGAIILPGPRKVAAPNYGVRFFGEEQVRFYTGASPMLGRPGSPVFFSPVEDMAVVRNAGDAAVHSGMAPSVTKAYVNGDDVFGISFPTTGLSIRVPTAIDAGGYIHFLEGGHTAVRLPGGAGYLVNTTREFVTPGVAVPKGAVLFKLGPDGEWIIQKRF